MARPNGAGVRPPSKVPPPPVEYRPASRPARVVVAFILFGMLLVWARSSGAQQVCKPPARCATPADVNAAADVLCIEDRKAASLVPKYRAAAEKAERDEAVCWGRNAELRRQLDDVPIAEPVHRSPWQLRRGLELAIAGGGIGAGAAVGSGAPLEVVVAAVVLEVALVVGRFALAWLDDR